MAMVSKSSDKPKFPPMGVSGIGSQEKKSQISMIEKDEDIFNNEEDDSVILAESRNFSQVSSSVPGLNIFSNKFGLGGPKKMGGAAATPQPPIFVYGTIKYDLSTLDINCVSVDIDLKSDI